MKMLNAQPQNLEKQITKTKYQFIEGVWESSVNMKYRILWQYGDVQPHTIVFLSIGNHTIL
jgi:hypothetical protein